MNTTRVEDLLTQIYELAKTRNNEGYMLGEIKMDVDHKAILAQIEWLADVAIAEQMTETCETE